MILAVWAAGRWEAGRRADYGAVRALGEEQASRLEFVAHFKIIEHQGVTINAAHSLARSRSLATRGGGVIKLIHSEREIQRARARRERRKRNNLRRIKLLSHYITSVELIRWHVLLLNEMIHINLNQCARAISRRQTKLFMRPARAPQPQRAAR
jgi:hypothetical protein